MTSLIATLEDRGYCLRQTDPTDARVQLVFLSSRGEALRGIQASISEDLLRRAWAGVAPPDKTACMHVLESVLANLIQA